MKPLCQVSDSDTKTGRPYAARKGSIMELLKKRLANLLTVKSIVTVVLTTVFAYLSVSGHVTTDQFLTVFTVVIAFYIGTQAEKRSAEKAEATANSGTDQAGGEAA